MIVLDASVLIAHLDASDRHHERAVDLLVGTADVPFGASTVTLADVLVAPARGGRLDAARAVLDTLGVRELPLADGAAARLASLRADTGLKLPDCCVLLAAQVAHARAIASFDDRLTAAAERLGMEIRA